MDQNPNPDEFPEKLIYTRESDLALRVGSPPACRIDGVSHPTELTPITADDTHNLLMISCPDQPASPIMDEIVLLRTDSPFAGKALVPDVESHRIRVSSRPVTTGLALYAYRRWSKSPSRHQLLGELR